VCVVADDRKLWQEAQACQLEFIFRATSQRNIQVWNTHRRRWEAERLQSLAQSKYFVYHSKMGDKANSGSGQQRRLKEGNNVG